MSEKAPPMIRQYFEIKRKYPECMLFFRLGDFYELFDEDAREGSKILGLTLTARHRGTDHEIAMCGVPHHSADRYIAELTRVGKKVALCEQISDPKLPGLVERKVVKIITPGTTLDESIVHGNKHHFVMAVTKERERIGISMLDITTGNFRVTECEEAMLRTLLFLLDPVELIVQDSLLEAQIKTWSPSVFCEHFELPYFEDPVTYLKQVFQVSSLSGFGIDHFSIGLRAAATLHTYVKEHQQSSLSHIRKLIPYQYQEVMILDETTLLNLELSTHLFPLLNQTSTRMGARRLRDWIISPLIRKDRINERLESVQELIMEISLRSQLEQEFKTFSDLERLVGRMGCQSANARDLVALKVHLQKIPIVKQILSRVQSKLLSQLSCDLEPLEELKNMLEKKIQNEPPPVITEGGLLKKGFHSELDRLHDILENGRNWLLEYQQRLKQETGISTLKVKFNKIFGYHIELTKAQSAKAPESFYLKQNLVSTNRYDTKELRDFEEQFLHAEEKIRELEYQLFQEIVSDIVPYIDILQKNASSIASLDVLLSLAQVALQYQYCHPQITEKKEITIIDGRHPVIEQVLKKQHSSYIANDTRLCEKEQLIVLTGPNMAGKSSYLRQVALITLMAHMGSFVPAASASIGLVDRIFTRVGARDDLSAGKSTFMVEMTEAASILNNATDRSLIIFDELGRGTSTYDGVSIAWAILEYVSREINALTLFATHYHELIDVAKEIPTAKNYSVAVAEKNGEVIFLRKIVDRGVDRSYGIEVAKLAGLPKQVIERSKHILKELEKDRIYEERTLMGSQTTLFSSEQEPHRALLSRLQALDTNSLTPLEALQYLHQLKQDL